MSAPKSYFTPGRGYLNETNDHSFSIPGWGYINEQIFFTAALALTQSAASASVTQKEKFLATLAPAETAPTAAIVQKEKFIVSLAAAQATNTAALTGAEKFLEALALTAPAQSANLNGLASMPFYPGLVAIGDAMQGGFLTPGDMATGNAAATDAALYNVQITESI